MSDDPAPSTDFSAISRIREAAAMSHNTMNGTACNKQQSTNCSFLAAEEAFLLTLKELSKGQKALDEKLSTQNDTLHKIELRLERGDSALANAAGIPKDVEGFKIWQAKAEGSIMMLKWLIGLAVGGGAAGVISIILFLAKK